MSKWSVILAGAITGVLAVFLVLMGNPPNMGICVACFARDISGALGFHRAAPVQYIRPEFLGFILGSFASALSLKEVRARGGSSPLIRFFIATGVAIGALVFLGCPLRMLLRLSAGDLNALVGLVGFVAGVYLGTVLLRSGYSLGRSHPLPKSAAYTAPLFGIALLGLLLARPAFIFFSSQGPGSQHAPIVVSLLAGLIVGALAQRSRLCMMGGVRDVVMLRDFHLISGFVSIFGFALVANLAFGKVSLSFANQPVAHSDGLFNFLGMLAVGFGSVLLGGCPLRQCIMAGEGDNDAMFAVLGLLTGGALSHNLGLAASAAGVPLAGQIAVVVVLFLMAIAGLAFRESMNTMSTRSSRSLAGEAK